MELCHGAGWCGAELWGRMDDHDMGQDGVGLHYGAGWMELCYGVGMVWGCAMGQDGVGLRYGAGWMAVLWGRMDNRDMGQDGVGLHYGAGWMELCYGVGMVWGCATGQDGVGLRYGARWMTTIWGRMDGAALWGRMVWG